LRGAPGLLAASLPIQIALQAAYDLPTGNPLKKHSQYDFNFRIGSEIQIITSGATWSAPTANRLMLSIREADFSIQVVGFDENRDLVIAASKVEDEAQI
jgi:hypothetical protein